MNDFLAALALVLVIEGVIYAAFPMGMKRMLAEVLALPEGALRVVGLGAAAVGLVALWAVRG